MRSTQHFLSILASTFLLAACGSTAVPSATVPTTAPSPAPAATVQAPPTAQATSMPTTAAAPTGMPATEAQATSVPTIEPTSQASTGVLPAPLYFNAKGQIARLERDGTTRTVITNEPSEGAALAVTDFAVSPTNGALVYVTQKPGGTALIGTDAAGKGRTVLFDRAGAFPSDPRWSPDGSRIAVGITPIIGDGTITGGGLYTIPAGGGEPTLLQANSVMPRTGTTELDPNLVGYSPIAFSPDGSKILAARYSQQVEMCGLAIIPVAGGAPVLIPAPEPALQTTCGPATWSADSRTLYTAFLPEGGGYSASAGLWRVDAATGTASVLVPAQANNQQVVIRDIASPHDGAISALISAAAKLPMNGDESVLSYQMARIDASSGAWMPTRTDTYTDAQVLWAPDGSGAVFQEPSDDGTSNLSWVSASGGAPTRIAERQELSGIAAWGQP